MSDKQFTIADMIGAVNDESPSNFQAAFNSILLDRIHDAINSKKIEIAKNYFNYEDETEEEENLNEPSESESNEGTADEDIEPVAREENE